MCNTARVWYINLRHTEIRYLMNNKTFNRNTDLHGMKRQVLIFLICAKDTCIVTSKFWVKMNRKCYRCFLSEKNAKVEQYPVYLRKKVCTCLERKYVLVYHSCCQNRTIRNINWQGHVCLWSRRSTVCQSQYIVMDELTGYSVLRCIGSFTCIQLLYPLNSGLFILSEDIRNKQSLFPNYMPDWSYVFISFP